MSVVRTQPFRLIHAGRMALACVLLGATALLASGCNGSSEDPAAADADAARDASTQAGATTASPPADASAAAGAQADGAMAAADLPWKERPCELLSAEMVAAELGLDAEQIEQTSRMRSRCAYEWKDKERRLRVEVRVSDWAEDVAKVARRFENSTRSMSAAEVSAAMDRVRAQAASDGTLDTTAKTQAAKGIASGLGAGGLQFQPVEGVGDQARYEPSSGDLHVRSGNLYFIVSGYLGAPMPTPAEINSSNLIAANKAWMLDTADQRRDTAAALARAVIAAL